MNQKIITYLRSNKDKYSKELLISSLQKAGYKERDILEGTKHIYGGASDFPQVHSTGFWNFKERKIYHKRSEKVIDFMLGLISLWIIWIIIDSIFDLFLPYRAFGFRGSELVEITMAVIYSIFLFYLFNRRRFLSYGIIACLIILIPELLSNLL